MRYYLYFERASLNVCTITLAPWAEVAADVKFFLFKVTQSPSSEAYKNHFDHRTHLEAQDTVHSPLAQTLHGHGVAALVPFATLACFSSVLGWTPLS